MTTGNSLQQLLSASQLSWCSRIGVDLSFLGEEKHLASVVLPYCLLMHFMCPRCRRTRFFELQ